MFAGNVEFCFISVIALLKTGAKIDKCPKNSAGKLSGPGALLFGIRLRAVKFLLCHSFSTVFWFVLY